jgi:hypothetical protein
MLWDSGILTAEPLLAAIERQQYDVVVAPLAIPGEESPAERYPLPKYLVKGFRGPLSSFDEHVRSLLAKKYRLYASSPGLRCCFYVRTHE